ncbi:hypothetical protein KM043_004456 [Ampulex compressa]|nr:hypothetical protein KM043_004456 [Ampulex compressa]
MNSPEGKDYNKRMITKMAQDLALVPDKGTEWGEDPLCSPINSPSTPQNSHPRTIPHSLPEDPACLSIPHRTGYNSLSRDVSRPCARPGSSARSGEKEEEERRSTTFGLPRGPGHFSPVKPDDVIPRGARWHYTSPGGGISILSGTLDGCRTHTGRSDGSVSGLCRMKPRPTPHRGVVNERRCHCLRPSSARPTSGFPCQRSSACRYRSGTWAQFKYYLITSRRSRNLETPAPAFPRLMDSAESLGRRGVLC